MKKQICCLALLLALAIGLAGNGHCGMSSANYSIPTCVVSGGGSRAGSTNFDTDATLGQSSPLMDALDPPYSTNYDLYPGFWYTVEKEAADICECDLNADGKCDMSDWLFFGQDWGRTDCNDPGVDPCECDLNDDGRCDMQDWLLFGEDWGRTDCPVAQ